MSRPISEAIIRKNINSSFCIVCVFREPQKKFKKRKKEDL